MRKILHWLTYPWAPISANQNVPAVSNWAWIPRPISIWQNTGSQKPRSFWKRRTSLSEILPPLLGFTKWATLVSASKKKRAVLQRLIGKWRTTHNKCSWWVCLSEESTCLWLWFDICKDSSYLFDLLPLHFEQSTWRLDGTVLPPLDTGIMWSTWRPTSSGIYFPQITAVSITNWRTACMGNQSTHQGGLPSVFWRGWPSRRKKGGNANGYIWEPVLILYTHCRSCGTCAAQSCALQSSGERNSRPLPTIVNGWPHVRWSYIYWG